MKTKTARQYQLSHNTTYKITSMFRAGDENACNCENCGAVITNQATVVDAKGKMFIVGLDCAQTLAGIGKEGVKPYSLAIARVNKFVAAAKAKVWTNIYWNTESVCCMFIGPKKVDYLFVDVQDVKAIGLDAQALSKLIGQPIK